MTSIPIDDAALAEARRFNRLLSFLPRFTIRNRFTPKLVQSLLRLSQTGGERSLRRAGIELEHAHAPGEPPVPLRILRPAGRPRVLILDFHGGGWAIGNAAMNDRLNAAFVTACDAVVVSVDYRLAPATPLEGMLADCVAAARWVLADGLPGCAGLPIIVVGESAGAHLAAATMLELQRWPALLTRISGAVMYYGVYDLCGTDSARKAGADTVVLNGPDLVPALARLTPHLNDAERRLPPLSPLYGDLTGLPPALLIAGESDPLIDDTRLMAAKWGAAAPVELQLLPQAPHGFIRFPTRMAALTRAWVHAWINATVAEGRSHNLEEPRLSQQGGLAPRA